MNRRKFLQYAGAGTASIYLSEQLVPEQFAFADKTLSKDFLSEFKSPAYPIPLPADGGSAETDAKQFSKFEVKDELTIPDGYRVSQIAAWGEKFGLANHSINFGYNCDHLTLVKRENSKTEYFLIVNHEYVSGRPWTDTYHTVIGEILPSLTLTIGEKFNGLKEGDMILPLFPNNRLEKYPELFAKVRDLAARTMREMGISVLHLELKNGDLEVIKNSSFHRRISAVERENISAETKFKFVGPGANFLPAPQGTLANCSGATTPWGTALTCEENIQDAAPDLITIDGNILDKRQLLIDGYKPDKITGIPLEWTGLGTCLETPFDIRLFGWVGEIIPETGELKKFTSLGRFRHENVTLSVAVGKKLRAYMGDDRRGGHVWRFQSAEEIINPLDRSSAKALEHGQLACAKFNSDFSGRWIPLALDTKLVNPIPSSVSEGYLLLPYRPNGGAVLVTEREKDGVLELAEKPFDILSPKEWIQSIESFTKKQFSTVTLGDLVTGASDDEKMLHILMDAFLMGNACGGTPSARPEDLEVHPIDNSIYIAFTDNSGKEQGSPDLEIFPDSKRISSRQYGAIYRIEEGNVETEFSWGKFISSGEVAESGAGFACVDNLAFDRTGNLWFVCDIATEVQNHSVNGGPNESAGEKYFPGIFGNSAMFVVPTSGKNRGVPKLFATGPMECELTGIKFYEDENLAEFLLVSVQHPGEKSGTGKGQHEIVELELKTRTGKKFKQTRTVPIGSNFPGKAGDPPKPAVFAVYRNT